MNQAMQRILVCLVLLTLNSSVFSSDQALRWGWISTGEAEVWSAEKFQILGMDLVNAKAVPLQWKLEYDPNKADLWPDIVTELQRSVCVRFSAIYSPNKKVSFSWKNYQKEKIEALLENGGPELKMMLSNYSTSSTSECFNGNRYPSFRVFPIVQMEVLESYGLKKGTKLRVLLNDNDGDNDDGVLVSGLVWKLQAFNGVTWLNIGGVNLQPFSDSKWIVDPSSENQVALLLMAEKKPLQSMEPKSNTVSPSPTPISKAVFTINEHKNLPVVLPEDAIAPIILWKKNQNDRLLRFLVDRKASIPAQGRYCIRVGYGSSGNEVALLRVANSDSFVISDVPVNFGTNNCTSESKLSFWATVRTFDDKSYSGSARFVVEQESNDVEKFDLSESLIRLRRSSSRENIAFYTPGEAGSWIKGDNGFPELYLGPEQSTLESEEIEFRFFLDGTGRELRLNGNPVSQAQKYKQAGPFQLSWDESVKQIDVCSDSRCTGKIHTFFPNTSPMELHPSRFVGLPVVYLDTVFGEPQKPQSQVSSVEEVIVMDGVDESETPLPKYSESPQSQNTGDVVSVVRLNTQLKFGSFSKPLTACVGHLVPDNVDLQPAARFKMELGEQIIAGDSWPRGVTKDDFVTISYDQNRMGDDCPINGIASEPISMAQLLNQPSTQSFTVQVASPESLFIGYVQLSGREYKKSRARWSDTLNFFNRAYIKGKEENEWVDGLLLGASDTRGKLEYLQNTPGNFPTELISELQSETIIESQVSRSDFPTVNFESGLRGVKSLVDNASISLMFFDDSMESFSCEEYSEQLVASNLNVKSAVVLTSKSNYTGDDSIRSVGNGLAHVCAEYSDQMELVVYAFDPSEQHKERLWDETFSAVYEDISNP